MIRGARSAQVTSEEIGCEKSKEEGAFCVTIVPNRNVL